MSKELSGECEDEDVGNERKRILGQPQELLNSTVLIKELTKVTFTRNTSWLHYYKIVSLVPRAQWSSLESMCISSVIEECLLNFLKVVVHKGLGYLLYLTYKYYLLYWFFRYILSIQSFWLWKISPLQSKRGNASDCLDSMELEKLLFFKFWLEKRLLPLVMFSLMALVSRTIAKR